MDWKCRATWSIASLKSTSSSVCRTFFALLVSLSSASPHNNMETSDRERFNCRLFSCYKNKTGWCDTIQPFYQTILLLAQSLLVDNHFHTMIPNTYMSHFAYACKMRYPLNLVLENIEYLWFYWTFCIVILDYGLKLHNLSIHTLVMLQKWLEIH